MLKKLWCFLVDVLKLPFKIARWAFDQVKSKISKESVKQAVKSGYSKAKAKVQEQIKKAEKVTFKDTAKLIAPRALRAGAANVASLALGKVFGGQSEVSLSDAIKGVISIKVRPDRKKKHVLTVCGRNLKKMKANDWLEAGIESVIYANAHHIQNYTRSKMMGAVEKLGKLKLPSLGGMRLMSPAVPA